VRRSDEPDPLALTDDQKAALRRAQVDLLVEFDRVCKAHDLEYFALYGTALGAVRHGGFIPWDDDLDIGMVRSSYDRMTQLINDELGERFLFQTVDTDPAYGCMFGKLRTTDTRCVDRISFGSPQHGGIFMDVFPLDIKATKRWAKFEQRMMRYIGFRFLYLKAGYLFMRGTSLLSRIIQAIARVTIRFIPRRLIIAVMERHSRLGGDEPAAEYVSLYGGYVYDRDTIDPAWIHPLTDVPFEDVTIPMFANADAYLTQIYDDYRQLPPLEQQSGHHEIVELDLGPTA
jgi:lipopolysaccharide cholinephosphotransferase